MIKIVITTLGIFCLTVAMRHNTGFSSQTNSVRRNGMEVSWVFGGDQVHFQISAPTTGWVAIGFNETDQLKNTYLIMGSVADETVTVLEHFVVGSEDYRSVETFGAPKLIHGTEGKEDTKGTVIKFSLPVKAIDSYRKELNKGNTYFLLMAFSLADDFQHHSIMRTQTKIQL